MEDTKKKTLASLCYEIHLRPTVILHNSLPVPLYALACGTVNEIQVPPGGSRILSSVEPGSCFVVLKVYNKKPYYFCLGSFFPPSALCHRQIIRRILFDLCS